MVGKDIEPWLPWTNLDADSGLNTLCSDTVLFRSKALSCKGRARKEDQQGQTCKRHAEDKTNGCFH